MCDMGNDTVGVGVTIAFCDIFIDIRDAVCAVGCCELCTGAAAGLLDVCAVEIILGAGSLLVCDAGG